MRKVSLSVLLVVSIFLTGCISKESKLNVTARDIERLQLSIDELLYGNEVVAEMAKGKHRVLEVIDSNTAWVYYASIEPREIYRVEIANGTIVKVRKVKHLEILNESGIVLEAPLSAIWLKMSRWWLHDFLIFVNSSDGGCRFSSLVGEGSDRITFLYTKEFEFYKVRCGNTNLTLKCDVENGDGIHCEVFCPREGLSLKSIWTALIRPNSTATFDAFVMLECRNEKFTKAMRVLLKSPQDPSELSPNELKARGILVRWYGTYSPANVVVVVR